MPPQPAYRAGCPCPTQGPDETYSLFPCLTFGVQSNVDSLRTGNLSGNFAKSRTISASLGGVGSKSPSRCSNLQPIPCSFQKTEFFSPEQGIILEKANCTTGQCCASPRAPHSAADRVQSPGEKWRQRTSKSYRCSRTSGRGRSASTRAISQSPKHQTFIG